MVVIGPIVPLTGMSTGPVAWRLTGSAGRLSGARPNSPGPAPPTGMLAGPVTLVNERATAELGPPTRRLKSMGLMVTAGVVIGPTAPVMAV